MRHEDFSIGTEFQCGGRRWRCTDIGRRTVIALPLEHDDDPSWYNGPPYAVAEQVFDEYDLGGCEPLTAEPTPRGIDHTRLSDVQEMEDLEYVERMKRFK